MRIRHYFILFETREMKSLLGKRKNHYFNLQSGVSKLHAPRALCSAEEQTDVSLPLGFSHAISIFVKEIAIPCLFSTIPFLIYTKIAK